MFLFLPVVLTVYALLPGLRAKNFWLLLMSLVFYAWGEVLFIFLLLASTLMNYFLGRWVDRSEVMGRRKLAVAVAIAANIGLLAFFKYADFVVATLNSLLNLCGAPPVPQPNIPLPIGISFFTFHALSYVIDIYRRKWRAAKDPKDVALYIFFFPQLIAGPILRWNAIAPQLVERTMGRDNFAEGVRRFVGGLAKKMMIANAVAVPADQIFALSPAELSTPAAWFGIVCYTLQIYFDFSGYSDMAVGMGKMFGFRFLENFDFPYTAQSIRDFWRRWHISLSMWFRDYLYIPLGGNRVSEARNHLNLLIVFFPVRSVARGELDFCGLGALPRLVPRIGADALRHLAGQASAPGGAILCHPGRDDGLGVVSVQHLRRSTTLFSRPVRLGHASAPQPLARYISHQAVWALIIGVPFCAPLWAG